MAELSNTIETSTQINKIIGKVLESGMISKGEKSRKYQGVFKVKSRVKTWQIRGIWSEQLEHKQVPKRETEPGVRKGKRSLLASRTRCKCSMETTHNSVTVKLGIKVMKLIGGMSDRLGSHCW